MPRAYCLIRSEPHYRRDAFVSGLRVSGYEVKHEPPGNINPGDLLLIWHRYNWHDLACRVERAGGVVVVAENAYIWTGGISPHHLKDRPAYALARGYHNDSTVIPDGGPERWNALGIDLKPWRVAGEHILVCPNRPFGTPGRIMSPDWPLDVGRRLQAMTKREVRVRPHPGNKVPEKPLAEDLAGAWACVIWSSSAGVHSLVAGIPVICEAPAWICKGAAIEPLDDLRWFDSGEGRIAALHRLAWGQYSLQEIASGFAFASVLRPEVEAKVAAGA